MTKQQNINMGNFLNNTKGRQIRDQLNPDGIEDGPAALSQEGGRQPSSADLAVIEDVVKETMSRISKGRGAFVSPTAALLMTDPGRAVSTIGTLSNDASGPRNIVQARQRGHLAEGIEAVHHTAMGESGFWRAISQGADPEHQVHAVTAIRDAAERVSENLEGDAAHNAKAKVYLEYEDIEGFHGLRHTARNWVPDLPGLNLYNKRLLRINLEGARLNGTSFKRASLGLANLQFAELNGSNFAFAKLTEAVLIGATMKEASLCNADLDRASLDGANLKDANLSLADLTGATLDGANLDGAILIGATFDPEQLRKAKNVDQAHFEADMRQRLIDMEIITETVETTTRKPLFKTFREMVSDTLSAFSDALVGTEQVVRDMVKPLGSKYTGISPETRRELKRVSEELGVDKKHN